MIAFPLDKPAGMSSQQALSAIKRHFKIKKIGHTGTLDPFATGVLPVFIGEATKLISFLDDSQKTYIAKLQLGSQTDTQDVTGEVVARQAVPDLNKDHIEDVLAKLVGEQLQTPPQYSAIKVQGKAMYRYAREGLEVKLEPRKIKIYSMCLLSFEKDSIVFEARVSRGTYIRSLGESIAASLSNLGHLSALRRTCSGIFNIEEAIPLKEILTMSSLESIKNLFPLRHLLKQMPHLITEDENLIVKLQHGQRISPLSFSFDFQEGQKACLYFKTSPLALVEVCRNEQNKLFLQPLRVFALCNSKPKE